MKDDFILDINTVDRLASLARLGLSESEKEELLSGIREMLERVSVIAESSTEGVVPTERVTYTRNVLREDVLRDGLARDRLISAAPDKCDGYVRVPTLIKESRDE